MADYKIQVGVELRTKDIDTEVKNYKGKVNVGTILDTDGIAIGLNSYKAKPIEVNSKLNTQGISDDIKSYKAKPIKVSVEPDFVGLEGAIKSHVVNTPLKVKVELNWVGIAGEIKGFTTEERIKLNAELNDEAIGKAIKGYKPTSSIKVDVDPDFSEAGKKISGYQMRNMLKVNVKLNKTAIDSQIKNFQTSKHIEVGAKLKDNAIESAITKYTAKELVPITVDFKVGDGKEVSQKINEYKNTPVDIPAKLVPASKSFDSGITKKPIQVNAELAPDAINNAISNPPKTLSKIPLDVKLVPKDINAQVRGLAKPTETIDVGVKLDESNINADIALFKPTATLGVKPDLVLEDVDDQIRAYIPKAKVKVNIDLNDSDIGTQNTQPPITVNAKLDRDDINTQIKNFKTNSKIKVGVKLDFASHKDDAGNEIQKGISKQIKEYNGKTKVKVGVELDKDSINQEVQSAQVSTPIRLGVELDPNGVRNVNDQLDNIRQQIQQLGNVTINFGGNPRNRGIGNVTSAFERATREVYNLYKQIESMELKLGKLEMSGIDAGNITTYRHQLDGLRQTYENLLATMSGQSGAINLDVVFTDIDRARTLITELSSSVDNARTKLAKDIKIDINNGKLQGEIDSVIQKFNQLGVANQGVTDSVEELQRMLTNMRVSDNIESVTSDYQEFLQLLKTVKNAVGDLEREINEANRPELLDATREAAMQRLNGLFEDGSRAAKVFGERAEQLRNELNMAGSTKGIELVNKKIKNLGTEVKNSGLQIKTFGSRLKEQFSKYSSYLSIASVFMYAEQGLRSMFEQVKLIDSAMTELKKVTDETDASYDQFLSNAASRAKEIGTTIDGLVSSTADFARLGYDFADAQGLAEVANIYAVVGDEIEGVEDATQSLISTLAAFKSEIGDMDNDEFALSIVDKMNEVANNYAISSGGLGEALQRSASSMAAANNSLDETIALITAANEVTQNPEKVGNAMKTISMRIRGAKTELEEAGESTDGMAESTASLRQEMLALSGVDIMLNENTFKSTYQIMDELSQKWEGLSDIAQATITELLAGKHQGNVMSSLMSNFDTARNALETSLNSSGSAMKEHEKWSQSLEAQLLKLKAAWQGLSQAFLSSDFLKGALNLIIDLVDGLTKLIDTIGAIPTLLTGFAGFKIITAIFKSGGLSGIKSFADILSALQLAFPNVSSGASKLVSALRNVAGAGAGANTGVGGLLKTLVTGHPYITAAVIAVSALTGAFIYQKKKAEELAKEVDEVVSEYKEQHGELKKLNGDYDTNNESSMINKYAKLSKGVDNLGRNISLTTDEYSEYQDIVNSIAEQIPSLVSGYDEQGNAILSCKGNVEQLTEAYEKLIHAQNQDVLANAGNIEKDFANTLEKQSGTHWWTNGHGFWKAFDFFKLADYELKDDTVESLSDLLNAKTKEQREQILSDLRNLDPNTYSAAEIRTALEDAGIEVKWYEDVYDVLEKTLDEDPQKISGIVDNYFEQFAELVEQQKTIASAKLSEAFDISNAISGLNYGNIGENLQDVAYQTINSLDYDFFKNLKNSGKTVEQWTTEMLNQLNSINKVDSAKIEAGFDLQTQFNGGEISYGEYVDNLRNLESTINELGLKDEVEKQLKISLDLDENGAVDQYGALVKRLSDSKNYDFKITENEAKSFLDGLSVEERQIAVDVITELDSNGVYETIDEIQNIVDREMVLQGLTFDLNLEVEAAGIESLNTALSESVTASGLSSDSISALKSRYADLESQGYDLSSMFEETSHGIHLNRNELSKLENELSKQKLAEVDADLNEMKAAYDELGEAIKNCDDPLKKSELYNERQSLAQKISECATLASQYKGLTSAYNDWLAAESAGNERDMYENVITGFETVKDELSRGWADDGTIKFLEMLTGRTDLAGKSGKELKEVYDGLDKKIKHTTHSVKDFFTVDKDGNSTSKGVYNFLDAVGQLEEEAFGGKDIVKRDGKGNVIGFDFELAGGDEAIAEALGVSEELVQIMVRAADDAGFVVSMDGTYRQLADLQNEAKAAADYLKEIGKTDFDFDFNTSSVSNLKEQLKEAKDILKDKSFWNADGTFNFDAKGATEAMTIVSTLQAKLDTLTQEQYGIGLTVEDKEFEEPLENLQSYGKKVAALNQLELNPKANAEEIKELNGELDDIAEYFATLDTDTKVKLGFEAGDGIEEVKSKIESGEVKIPTTLDIQTNMDKNLSDLRDLALLNSGLLNPDQEEAIKIRLGIEVDPEVNNPESVGDAINNAVGGGSSTHTSSSGSEHGGSGGSFTIEPKVDVDPEPEVNEESFGAKLWNGIKSFFGGGDNGVETGGDGQLKYRIGVDPEPEVKTEGAKEEVKKKTEEAIQSESGETTTVEKDVQLELNIGDYIDNLSEFEDIAKRISKLDGDISATVTANIEGNVLGAGEGIDNLAKFVEGAKSLEGVESSDVSVDVDFDGNITQIDGLDKLAEFAEGAKALQDVKSSDVSVKAELECEFNGGNLDSLAKFVDSASKLDGVKSSDVSVEVNLDGNLSEWKGNLEDIGTFAKNAKELNGVEDADVSIRVNLESEFNETDFDDLAKFVANAKELQGTKDSEVSINANLDGNLGENTNIDKLKTFAEGAGLLKDVKTKEIEITTNLYGNLAGNPNLYNLETFADGVEKLQDVKGKEVEVTANLYGNLIDNPNLYGLDDFADGAKNIQDLESKEVRIDANLYGNLIQNPNLYSLDDFAEGAEALQDSESKKVEITTNLYGNLVGNPNLYSLDDFAEGAEALQDVDGKKVEITANLYGNLVGNPNLYSLDDFADGAAELQDVEGKKVEITANLYGNLIQNPNLYSLDDFADGAKDLQGVESKKVEITTNLYGNLIGNQNLYSLKTFADGAEDLQGVESKNVRIDANLYGNLIGNGNLSNLGTFAARAKELKGIGNVNISVKANVDAASINTAITSLTQVANSGLFKDYNATVTATVNYVKGEQTKPEDMAANVNYNLGTQANPKDKTAKVNYALGSQASPKSKTVYVDYVERGTAAGTAFAGGTSGRAFARGDWGIKGSGVALAGEFGPEIVVRQGKFFTVGDSGAEFFRYKPHDIVFNAAQTESLFKYGGIKGAKPRGKMLASGTAFASGNAFSDGIGGGFWTNSSTGQSYGSKSSDSDSSSDKDFEEVIDWIEVIIDRVERSIDKFDQQANNIYKSWSSRNSALQSEISEVSGEINIQQQAYSRYLSAANGVGLSSSWQNKVKNGTIDISTIKDEALAEKISSYKEWYEKALDAKDAIRELQEQESKLYAQRFEHLQTQYDGILQGYEHTEAMLNEYISQAEEQGYIVSKKYYEALVTNEKQNINALKQEQAELIKTRDEAVASGKITKNSEAWLKQCAAIDEITQAIEESTTALLEFDNAMREIDWSIFDLIQERISGITEESDFLIELMSNKDLFDDNGKFTSQGLATLGLHAQNVNTHMYAADTYGEEVAKLDAQIAKDPYDQELINRRNELLELQRESILAAEQEKDAIKDLVENGIEEQLNSLQELIDKKNEALESERDLYEYQKKVAEQSKEVASLEKQLAAYAGDDSEEAKQKIQQIKVDLESARQDLQETEMDKILDDTSALLDNLFLEAETLLNERIDNIDYLLEQVIETINIASSAEGNIATALGSEGAIAIAVSNNATSIKDTLTSETNKVGTTLSNAMNSIWNSGDGNAKSVLTMYGEDFKSKSATIITTLNGIKSSVNSMVSSLNKEATTKTKANKTTTSAKKNPTASSSSSKKKTTTTTKKSSSGDDKPKIGDRVKYVSGQYYYDSQGKKPLGSHNKGEYVYITNINTRDWATHGYHISTGNKLGKGDLGWLKLNQLSGYASGKEKFYNDENAWTQEDGREFIVRPSDGAILTPIVKGDSILNATASGNIWNMANSPAEFIKENLKLDASSVPNTSSVNNSIVQNFENITFSMPNVHGYNELLSEMQRDPKFEKFILSMTIDQIAGRSKLAKGKSIR